MLVGPGPGPHGSAQAGIVPPRRMETRARLQNTLALLHRRRQRPRGGDDVRIGEVLEQEIPVPRVHVVEGFEAARDEARRHCGGNLIVERDLLAARVPRAAGSVGVPGLEDDGARSAGSSGLVRQAQPENAREHRGACALHHDIADTTISERAGTAERVGEMLGVGRDSVVMADLQDNLRERPPGRSPQREPPPSFWSTAGLLRSPRPPAPAATEGSSARGPSRSCSASEISAAHGRTRISRRSPSSPAGRSPCPPGPRSDDSW